VALAATLPLGQAHRLAAFVVKEDRVDHGLAFLRRNAAVSSRRAK
jgi:hypothetical protein